MKERTARKNTIICIIVSLLVILLVLYLLQRLLMPKYMSGIVEGAMVAEYYEEEKNHDVIFIGDCEVYESITPQVLWDEYGINSYVRGTAQQLIWQSYYLMEETFRYEKPDVVVFNVLSMQYDEPQKEPYNRMTLDNMRWSKSKIDSIFASMTEDESFLEYVFPLLRYHSRWDELTGEDFKYFWQTEPVTHNGYYMQTGVEPAGDIPEKNYLADYEFGEKAYQYLDKMVALCEENGVELVLIKAPSLYPHWHEEWEMQIENYAKDHNLRYYNLLEVTEEIGLDYTTDTYDAGLHLNLSGAEKLSHYFGSILVKDCGLQSRRGEVQLEASWDGKRARYNEEKTRRAELK